MMVGMNADETGTGYLAWVAEPPTDAAGKYCLSGAKIAGKSDDRSRRKLASELRPEQEGLLRGIGGELFQFGSTFGVLVRFPF